MQGELLDLKCRYCEVAYPLYARTMGGAQRSGYRLLMIHMDRQHNREYWTAKRGRNTAARTDDLCPSCEGKGCTYCEPSGPLRYDFNTAERVP